MVVHREHCVADVTWRDPEDDDFAFGGGDGRSNIELLDPETEEFITLLADRTLKIAAAEVAREKSAEDQQLENILLAFGANDGVIDGDIDGAGADGAAGRSASADDGGSADGSVRSVGNSDSASGGAAPELQEEHDREEDDNEEEGEQQGQGQGQGRCGICMQALSVSPVMTLACSHEYHRECVEKLRSLGVKEACPMCRAELPPGPEKLFEDAISRWLALHRRHATDDMEPWQCGDLGDADRREIDEVMGMLREAAEGGDADAQRNLGFSHEFGQGVALFLLDR